MSLEQHYTAILGQLGEDVNREGLRDTPKRAAKAMQYLCRGYQQSLEEIVNGALFAKAEVVVMNGNYGLRIVELSGSGLSGLGV